MSSLLSILISTWIFRRAVMFFFTLADTGDIGKLPLITIPAQ